MKVSDFDFDLPEELIATEPVTPRDSAKLLQVSKFFFDFTFKDLPDLLNPGDVLVFNDTKVIPARLFGTRRRAGAVDADIELLLHQQHKQGWTVFAKPGKKLAACDRIEIADDFSAVVKDKYSNGEIYLEFNVVDQELYAALQQYGHVPLPPYIKREDTEFDRADYQTIYAREPGAVAAPTAGLHFTAELLSRLHEKGVLMTFVTLHVGAGTFQPVKVEDTDEHDMHSEYIAISQEAAELVNRVRAKGGKVIAVGTTSLRLLESVVFDGEHVEAFTGETDLFITPGYQFKVVDRLITNFHLPKSTLFMLVAAFSGLERMKAAYEHAKRNGYRFYSYGDGCLLDRMS